MSKAITSEKIVPVLWELDSLSLSEAICYLQGLQDKFIDTHENLYLDAEEERDCTCLYLRGTKKRTQAEIDKELAAKKAKLREELEKVKTQLKELGEDI